MKKKITFTETGASDSILVGLDNQFTFASTGDQGDYTMRFEVQLVEQGNWFTAQDMADEVVYSTVTGVHQVRFVCSSMGTATSIDAEICGSKL